MNGNGSSQVATKVEAIPSVSAAIIVGYGPRYFGFCKYNRSGGLFAELLPVCFGKLIERDVLLKAAPICSRTAQ